VQYSRDGDYTNNIARADSPPTVQGSADNHAGEATIASTTEVAASSPVVNQAGRAHHSPLCPECAALLDYSLDRIEACRFGAGKPTCAHCVVHCFRPAMREQIRAAMRYSGPRMTYRHPYLALRHLMDRRREPRAGR
jgi:Nitrous oxide-stimulated promoter